MVSGKRAALADAGISTSTAQRYERRAEADAWAACD